jgi:hypothetical protein
MSESNNLSAEEQCIDCAEHESYPETVCESCKLEIDQYGNTEGAFKFCCFPDCGCDGARVCMSPSGASERAMGGNVEGMWSGKTRKQRAAVFALVAEVNKK